MSSRLRKRLKFEKEYAPSSKNDVWSHIWFHASSEGEWEQIWPIVTHFLESSDHKEKLTIWFTSPSLENKVKKLKSSEFYQQHSERLQVFSFSILTLFPWGRKCVLAYPAPKTFFMVRYDFFAELMWQGLRSDCFILLTGTLKNKERALKRNLIKKFLAHNKYGYFDRIYAATETDVETFRYLLGDDPLIECFDFRHSQIIKRQESLPNLGKCRALDSLKIVFEKYQQQDRLILGNYWSHEREIFTEDLMKDLIEEKKFLFIAPHMLKGPEFDEVMKQYKELCEQYNIEPTIWDEVGINGEGPFVLCRVPGLLCEIYSFFGHCYVGGGFGRSIHSILEPFWGGGIVYCGPKTHRSTEVDFALEFNSKHHLQGMNIVKELTDFYPLVQAAQWSDANKRSLEELKNYILKEQKVILASFRDI